VHRDRDFDLIIQNQAWLAENYITQLPRILNSEQSVQHLQCYSFWKFCRLVFKQIKKSCNLKTVNFLLQNKVSGDIDDLMIEIRLIINIFH
jgi:hypothetical protein